MRSARIRTGNFMATILTILVVSGFTTKAYAGMACYVRYNTPIYDRKGSDAKVLKRLSPRSRIDLTVEDMNQRGWIQISGYSTKENIDADDINPHRISVDGHPLRMYVYAKEGLVGDFASGCVD